MFESKIIVLHGSFSKFSKDVNVSPTRTFFLLNDKKKQYIYICIFDPSHISKVTRYVFSIRPEHVMRLIMLTLIIDGQCDKHIKYNYTTD